MTRKRLWLGAGGAAWIVAAVAVTSPARTQVACPPGTEWINGLCRVIECPPNTVLINKVCRLVDGQQCGGAADCASGLCIEAFLDFDGDGFGSLSIGKFCGFPPFFGGDAPTANGGDCCDLAEAGSERVFPGQAQRFEAPVPEICRGQTTHDYDCDGVDEAIGDGFFAGCEGAAAGCERRSGPLRDSVIDHFDVPPACGTSCIQTQCAVFDGRCRVSAEEIFTALACR